MVMTDEPFFFEAQIHLLGRNGMPLRFPLQRQVNFALTEVDPMTPTFAVADRLTFRHSSADGDPVQALADRLEPHLGIWLAHVDQMTQATTSLRLAARLVGDVDCRVQLEANPQVLAAQPDAERVMAQTLLRRLSEMLIERMFTGQDRSG